MKNRKSYTVYHQLKHCLYAVLILIAIDGTAQEKTVIQFSGIVYTHVNTKEIPIPYAGVGIKRTRRGTLTDENGFFSLVSETGDTIIINSLGYKPQRVVIPYNLNSDRYFQKITLEQDTFQLEPAVVYSIPSKEHFKPEFLEMDVIDKLKDQAEKNLAPEVLEQLAPFTPSDGRAGVSLYFSQQSQKLYYEGQFKPQRIFDAMAWVEFIKALKRGDFKKKKKKE